MWHLDAHTSANIIAINNSHTDTDATEATVAEELDGTIDADTVTSAEIATGKEDDSETLGSNNISIGAQTPELPNLLDFFEYLTGTPMLCEVVCSMWGGDKGQDRDLRAQRVAALRARWIGRLFPGPLWLSSPHVSTMDQYSTDPHTGECKTQ